MKRHRVDSTAIRSAGYDRQERVLEIAFRKGGVYEYHDVSRQRAKAFDDANSKGRYFNRAIRPTYDYRKVK